MSEELKKTDIKKIAVRGCGHPVSHFFMPV